MPILIIFEIDFPKVLEIYLRGYGYSLMFHDIDDTFAQVVLT